MWQRFTETARRVILRSEYEATQRQSPQVETEHLLLALLSDTGSDSAKILSHLGITPQKVRSTLYSQGGENNLDDALFDSEVNKLSEEFRVPPAFVRQIERQVLLKLREREQAPKSELKLSGQLKRVLELASDEARRDRELNERSCDIGTGHLLLALLRDREGKAAVALHELGLNLEQARHSIFEFLRGRGEEPTTA